jgi:RNA polymerase primary sigma factor
MIARQLALVLAGALLPRVAAPRRRPSPGEIARLVARARRGDRRAREQVVSLHLRLVRAVAGRYRGLGLPYEDLVQEGAIGLLDAIDRFDARRGTSFSTYAHLRVRNAVTRAVTENGRALRLPKAVVERRRLLARAGERLGVDGHRPSVDELADVTGFGAHDVVDALAAPGRPASLDAPLPDGSTLEALVPDPCADDPEDRLLVDERRRLVDDAVARLAPRRRLVVRRYFGLAREPESLGEIAAELDVSSQRARAIRDDALDDLADELEDALRDESYVTSGSASRSAG